MPRGKSTTVEVSADGCTIRLTHRIYFHDADSYNPAFDRQVADARRRIMATWQPHGGFRCGDCTILFDFVFVPVEDGATRDDVDGKHIFGSPGVSSQSGLGPVRRPGCWFSEGETLPEAAHEVGHELGMTDKYRFVRFDPAAPDDQGKWQEVPDPRGVGRGSQPNLPPDIRCVPRGTYPANGLAFRVDGVPLEADLREILAANGVECNCRRKRAGDAAAEPREHAHEEQPGTRRTSNAKSGRATGALPRGGETRPRIPPPWTDTEVPPAQGEIEEDDDPRDEEEPTVYGEELDAEDMRPLVFVPGLMGSMLRAGAQVVWPPDRRNFVAQINAMRNASVAKTPSGLVPSIYDALIRFIERPRSKGGLGRTRPQTYEIFPYDWTSSCRDTGRLLKEFIDDWLQRINAARTAGGKPAWDNVDVLAHSFGGYVARIAKRRGGAIGKVVFMGTPHQGAPKSYFTLHHQVPYADSFGVLKDFGIKVLLWWNEAQLPDVPTREELLWRIALATESAWELMPDDRHMQMASMLAIDGRPSVTWQEAYLGGALNGSWGFAPVWDATISEAMALKDGMRNPQQPFQNVVAERHLTPAHIDYDTHLEQFSAVDEDRPGDATVMANSASAGGGRVITVRAAHADIPADRQAHQAIRAFIG